METQTQGIIDTPAYRKKTDKQTCIERPKYTHTHIYTEKNIYRHIDTKKHRHTDIWTHR